MSKSDILVSQQAVVVQGQNDEGLRLGCDRDRELLRTDLRAVKDITTNYLMRGRRMDILDEEVGGLE